MLVKICGVRTIEGARAVASSGADLAGINFIPTSKRFVATYDAFKIAGAFENTNVELAGVFADQSYRAIADVLDTIPLRYVQLHGSESAELCAALALRTRVIKAVPADELPPLDAYLPHVALFLLDGPRPGTGVPFAWRPIALNAPFLIAGGLDSSNVAEAIRVTSPFGVDTASGVEINGKQDPARIEAFVRAAKGAK